MYYVVVFGLMLVLPALSVAAELLLAPGADFWAVFGKWFVFWGVGGRLGVAGVRQILQPGFTAKDIFQIADPAAGKIVQELGFANVAMGAAGLLSIAMAGWVQPVAFVAAIFYGLAGALHLTSEDRNAKEVVALGSDLFMAVILFIVAGSRLWS